MTDPKFTVDYETPFFSIEKSKNSSENGYPYYRLIEPDAVIICAFDERLNAILVRQNRPNLGYITSEFPAGGIEKNEIPLEAARREFLEETGHSCNLINLGKYRLSMHRTNSVQHIFFGFDAVAGNVAVESGVELLFIPRKDLNCFLMSEQFEQLPAIGIIHLISVKIGADLLNAPIEIIRERSYKLLTESLGE